MTLDWNHPWLTEQMKLRKPQPQNIIFSCKNIEIRKKKILEFPPMKNRPLLRNKNQMTLSFSTAILDETQ